METLQYSTETKAIKEHKCSFCNEKISVGEKYLKSTHKYDGEVYDWKAHKYCNKLAHILNMFEDADEGVTQDIFMETVSEVHDDILISILPQDEIPKYSPIIQQIRHVKFRDKMWFVLRHYNKMEANKDLLADLS
jgi:hypothetical protein